MTERIERGEEHRAGGVRLGARDVGEHGDVIPVDAVPEPEPESGGFGPAWNADPDARDPESATVSPLRLVRFVVTALTDQSDVAHVQVEVVLLPNARDEGVELRGGHVVYASASLAHQMAVRAREMEERRTARLMHVLEHSPLSQRVEGPVHG